MRAVLFAAVALAGCSSEPLPVRDGGYVDTCFQPTDAGVFVEGFPALIPGCGGPGSSGAVLDLRAGGFWPVGGVLVVPAADAGVPLPVVLVFHGAYGNGAQVRQELPLDAAADAGAIFVYPDAIARTWDIGPQSQDALAVDTLLRGLSERFCIDPSRIYAAGFSAGAIFTLYLGCNEGQTFRAIASVAGSDDRFDVGCCKVPTAAMLIHGTDDVTIPFDLGAATIDTLREENGCSTQSVPDGSECVAYRQCTSGRPVDWCPWPGEHFVPDWAAATIWSFFAAGP